MEATFSSSQRFVLPVAFEQPSLEIFDLFDEVIVFGRHRARALHHALQLLFEFGQPPVACIEQAAQAVGDVTKPLSLFFEGFSRCFFHLKLPLGLVHLVLEGADFIGRDRR